MKINYRNLLTKQETYSKVVEVVSD
jgi:hypothetical protein